MAHTRRARRTRRRGGQRGGSRTSIAATYLITLDTSSARFKHAKESLDAADVPFHVRHAVNGRDLNLDTLPNIGIGRSLYESRNKASKPHNLGAIGCFLSHRGLYRDIIRHPRGPETQYLILEDDVLIPAAFLTELAERLSRVPEWDIIYMSKMNPIGKRLGHGLIRLKRDPTARKNIGTWAYLIKEKCVRRLVALLEDMKDQIDAQINQEFDTMRAYCFEGAFVSTQNNGSEIEAMEVSA